MNQNPTNLPERLPSEPDPPHPIAVVRRKKTVKWALSGFFNLKKWKGGFKGKRQVTVETYDD